MIVKLIRPLPVEKLKRRISSTYSVLHQTVARWEDPARCGSCDYRTRRGRLPCIGERRYRWIRTVRKFWHESLPRGTGFVLPFRWRCERCCGGELYKYTVTSLFASGKRVAPEFPAPT